MPSEVLPTEIFERIIDFLHSDKAALISCSLVSRNWFPSSRYHLYTLLPIIPTAIREECPQANCAVALSNGSLLYGTKDGLYLSRDGTLVRLLQMPEVSQVEVLEPHNMLFIHCKKIHMLIGPLHLALTGDAEALRTQLLFYRPSSNLSGFFQLGRYEGKPVVCIVLGGQTANRFDLVEIVESEDPAAPSTLRSMMHFHLYGHASSVQIWDASIGIATVSPESVLCVNPRDRSGTLHHSGCRAMFRLGTRFLMCYSHYASYSNAEGTSAEAAIAIQWEGEVNRFVLAAPYLLTFTDLGLHAWHIPTGVRIQTFRGTDIRLLSAASDTRRLVVKMGDGRIVVLRCADVPNVREWQEEGSTWNSLIQKLLLVK
ncbi:CNH domain-containing protein [Mycena filopes]|nr:CNH domain-containing protein [Mycena filopes]